MFYAIAFSRAVTLDVKVISCIVKVATPIIANFSRFDRDVFHYKRDVCHFDRDVFHFDSLATTDKSHKKQVAKGVAIHRTKASTFALEKNAKELAFSPPHLAAFVQLDSFSFSPPQKKLKPLVSILRTRRKIMTFRVFVQTKMNIFDMLTRQD